MSDCCTTSSTTKIPTQSLCPINGQAYKSVPTKTVMHNIHKPWLIHFEQQKFYFCDDPSCSVVYFSDQNMIININECRTKIGHKLNHANSTLCYCFGVSFYDAKKDPTIKEFVTLQTKNKSCQCDIKNPSGKCCLKDFPK